MTEKADKVKKAVALRYDEERDTAPVIVASGTRLTAEKIIKIAKESGVTIKEDPDLLELLAKIPVGSEIPEELYQTIAEILSFVYKVNARYKEKDRSTPS